MRRELAYPVVWMVATAVTVGGTWLGIRSVLDAASPSRPDPLSAADLRRAAPTTTPARIPVTSAPPTTVAPPPTTRPTPPPTTRAPTTRPPVRPGPTSDPRWIPVPDEFGGTAYRRTLRVQGGEVSVQVGRSGARILSTRAAAGFISAETRFDEHTVSVTFVSDRHTSRIMVAWRNGPHGEVSESV
jgi:hypothetical protein